MNLVRAMVGFRSSQYRAAFERATQDPERAYRDLWEKEIFPPLVRQGRALSPSIDGFPITEYRDYDDALKKSFEGKRSLLTGEKVKCWGISTGTTGNHKIYPIAKAYRNQIRRVSMVYFNFLLEEFPRLLDQPMLGFFSPCTGKTSPAGVEIGFIGNYIYRTLPKIFQSQYAVPAALLGDAATLEAWAPLYALSTDMSGVMASVPSAVVRFLDQIEKKKKTYLDVVLGRASLPAGLPRLKIARGRRELVLKILRSETAWQMKEMWPSLQVVCCWRSSICEPQVPVLRKRLGEGIPIIENAYASTEAFFTVPIPRLRQTAGVLHVGAHIFEFIRYGDELRTENLLKPWELQEGESYEIFLTTAAGLVRYRIRDVVKCHGFYNRAPLIAFEHKSDHVISLGLSAISERQLSQAALTSGFALSDQFRFGPNMGGNGLVLYHPDSLEVDGEELKRLEERLREMNCHYHSMRSNGGLVPLGHSPLPGLHSIFESKPLHAQSKSKFIVQTCPK